MQQKSPSGYILSKGIDISLILHNFRDILKWSIIDFFIKQTTKYHISILYTMKWNYKY